VTQSGYYNVTGTNIINSGCQATSQTIEINASNVLAPEICMVTVDTNTNSNVIVWEKPITQDIDSFIVFKETYQAGIYGRIGAVDYADLSEFNDTASQPKVHADRYKLAARDTCGGITLPSAFHKTMHLQVNAGIGIDRNLSWSHEEGISSNYYYRINRLHQNVWTTIDSIQNNINTYSDLNVPDINVDYIVEIKLPQPCTSVKNIQAARVRCTSNGTTNKTIAVPDDVGVEELMKVINVNIVPNPSNGKFNLTLDAYENQMVTLGLITITGQVVENKETSLKFGKNMIPFEVSSSGMYFLIMKNKNGTETYKVVVE